MILNETISKKHDNFENSYFEFNFEKFQKSCEELVSRHVKWFCIRCLDTSEELFSILNGVLPYTMLRASLFCEITQSL